MGRGLSTVARIDDAHDTIGGLHICRFEQMEQRQYLTADLHLGAVYFEDATGDDSQGDTIQISFQGGEPGTELSHVVIDGDKSGDGPSAGDVFFDVAPGGAGAFGSAPLKIVSSDGFEVLNYTVSDGGSKITFDLKGFKAGMKLVFTVDTDEIQYVDPDTGVWDENAIVEGGEFQRSHLFGTFTAAHFENATGHAQFWDAYDDEFAIEAAKTGTTLHLPPDRYSTSGEFIDRTAGAVTSVKQTPKPITLTGTVFEDRNLSNTQQAGEPGIAGVSLSLFVWNGSSYVPTGKTTVTNAIGDYKFDGLLPGKYRVVETQPSDYFSVGASAGNVAGQTRGVVASADILSEITLLGGDDSVDNDFAESKPNSISGQVHVDNDGDCTFTPGDEPLAGVTIELRDATGVVIRTAVTDANGMYRFDDLMAGTYSVFEVQPAGYIDGGEDVGTAGGEVSADDTISGIVLVGGTFGEHYDFCEMLPSSLSGYVHADIDGDCVFDPEEVGIEGVVIQLLDADGAVLQVTTTDAGGRYRFDNLRQGEYQIREFQPAGYFDSGDHPGSEGGVRLENDLISQINLKPGRDGVEYHFCEIPPAMLCGYVYHDANNNGVKDSGEQGIAGVTIVLKDAAGNPTGKTEITDETGRYCFDDLPPGTYGVEEVQPVNWLDGLDAPGDAGGTANNPGDLIVGAVLKPTQHAENYNFGELLPASVRGHVHADTNGNCLLDPGEVGIAGVVIKLFDNLGNLVATTQTDASGNYVFSGLMPGRYTIEEVQPAGYYDGGDFVGSAGGVNSSNDVLSQIDLGSGVDAVDYNFCEKPPASISGHVHADTNGNCELDPGEKGIAGVVIKLYDANGTLVGTTQTDADGNYLFSDLAPGTYTVQEVQPNGYFDGGDAVGSAGGVNSSNDVISEITLGGGVNAVDYNFCEKPPGAISGYVFVDGAPIPVTAGSTPNVPAVKDGLLTPDDKRLPGIVMELRDGVTGVPIYGRDTLGGYPADQVVTVVTDANGYYEFKGLRAGSYAVYQQQDPTGFIDGLNTAGSTGGLVMSAYTQVDQGILDQLQVLPGSGDALLQIVVTAGGTSTYNNFSEVTTEQPFFFTPPPVTPIVPVYVNVWLPPAPPVTPPPFTPPPDVPRFLYGGSTMNYTWHLSVIDAGHPRGDEANEVAIQTASLSGEAPSWKAAELKNSTWTLSARTTDGKLAPARKVVFGLIDSVAITGDFNGDGVTDFGVFKDGEWFIDVNGNGEWDAEDLWAKLGTRDDKPVTGDWNGDGKTDIGIYGPAWARDPHAIKHEPGIPDPANTTRDAQKNHPPRKEVAALGSRALKLTAEGKTRADLIDHVFHYGTAEDIPITGDWNGDGIDTIGIFNAGKWYRDLDGNGRWSASDPVATFGQEDDTPVVGDWNGDGRSQLGVYRAGTWYLDSNGNDRLDDEDEVVQLGDPNDSPVVGDWDGDGRDEIGIVENGKILHGERLTQSLRNTTH